MTYDKIHLLGAGRAGRAVVALCRGLGFDVGYVVSTQLAHAKEAVEQIGGGLASTDVHAPWEPGTITLIGVPDRLILPIAEQVAEDPPAPGAIALHLSGAITAEALASLRVRQIAVGSLHPAFSFADRKHLTPSLRGVCFAVDGDTAAREQARRLVTKLEGQFLPLSSETKPLHHAATSVASNFLVTVFDLACRFEQAAGISLSQSHQALLPLVESTLGNLRERGTPDALTGPIERGDVDALRLQLRAIRQYAPAQAELFLSLARATIDVAAAKGSLSAASQAALQQALEEP